jgi:hypothetical protein
VDDFDMVSILPEVTVLPVITGTVTVNGSVTLSPTSTTILLLDPNADPTAVGVIVTGCAAINGVLRINLQDSLTAALQVQAITSPCLSGNFTHVQVFREAAVDQCAESSISVSSTTAVLFLTPKCKPTSKSNNNAGLVAGATIGAVVGLSIIVLVVLLLLRRSGRCRGCFQYREEAGSFK